MAVGFRLSLIPLGLAGGLLLASPAFAQTESTGQMLGKPQVPLANQKNVSQAPPPGLPGARSATATASLPDHLTTDMPPNEALFDGINRGDMITVKDALTRGADLNNRNVLGLTPVDLSVDLGRNEITFLLLSMRAAAPSSRGPAPPPSRNALAARNRDVTRVASRQAEPDGQRPVRANPRTASATANRQYVSRDPGTPVPQAGFLGFGGTPGR